MPHTVILGSGMAGLGAAHRLRQEGVPSITYDKNAHPGGHTASVAHPGGFIFDEGPHVSFSKHERFKELLADNVDREYETFHASVNNHWKGHWIKHPAICNLHGLPTTLVVNIIKDLIGADRSTDANSRNYADWLVQSYGETFARTFPMEYGLKYHTLPASKMDVDWLGPRLYRPKLDEVLQGALTPDTPDVHYIDEFRYPRKGGFVGYLQKLFAQTDIQLDHRVVQLDTSKKLINFANGKEVSYESVISSVPLPELLPMLVGTPQDVLAAGRELACSQCVVVSVGLNRSDISDAHWTYIYDRDVVFTRLSFPHMFAEANAPMGTGSIQAEVYFSDKYSPMERTADDYVQPVVSGLKRLGFVREDDRILHTSCMLIPYANIIFDLDRAKALQTVHGYLDDVGVRYCGRYGDWGYMWTDQSFISGERAAESVLDDALSASSYPG